MPLALFDLDNTLLAGDSDYLWGRYLAGIGVVDGAAYEAANQRFYDDYRAGRLDIDAFLRFALAPLAAHPRADLERWRAGFMATCIEPIITAAALALVARHRAAGDTLVVITATNSFVTAPIVARFGIPHLIATEPALRPAPLGSGAQAAAEGPAFTGAVAGVPAFREGKVTRLRQWLAGRHLDLVGSHFYSDSINDLPLLEQVTHPVAVDPDPALAAIAAERGWPIQTLRAGTGAGNGAGG